MITVKQAFLVDLNDKTRIQNTIEVDGAARELWFEVERKYAPFLCTERSDAYVIGLLNWAMRNRHDITSETPMSEELHYQLTSFLIPALTQASKNLYPCRIIAPLDPTPVKNAGAVGTGLSCGVDSLHVLFNQSASRYSSLNITHVIYNNVGAHGVGQTDSFREHKQIIENFARETGYSLINIDSNFAGIFNQDYALTHIYSNCCAVFLMQKLWSVYFYASSGLDFNFFNLKNNDKKDPAYYDLLSLQCFSTRSLRIYPEGGAKTRFEKTRAITAYPPAKKYLNVCCAEGKNCGKCEKCIRTMLNLEALGVLDEFQSVFDTDYYRNHKSMYYTWLCLKQMLEDPFMKETYRILLKKITLFHRLMAVWQLVKIPLRKVSFLQFLRKKENRL
jgi:bacterioferritin-associated ferredoxin